MNNNLTDLIKSNGASFLYFNINTYIQVLVSHFQL